MLSDKLQELEKTVEQLDLCITSIYSLIHEALSHPAKNFTVTFKKEKFELYHPFDPKERLQVEKNKKKYINRVLQHVMKKRIADLPSEYKEKFYETLFAFFYGKNPEDLKISASSMSNIMEKIKEQDKEFGKRRKLDEEAYQVKMQKKDKSEFEEYVDLEEEK